MRPWNKPIRFNNGKELREYEFENRQLYDDLKSKGIQAIEPESYKSFGVTNWMVGTCKYPWSPWVQISFGYASVQIKWYLIVLILIIVAFIAGYSI
ncbi:hypothetical protein D1872_51140 [compost metagenome]